MVDDLIRLYDKDAKPKSIKSNSNKKSTTVLKGSNAENWMISKNAYFPRVYGNVETSLNSLIGEYSQNNNINNGAVNVMVGNDDKIFYKYSKEPSTDFIKNMFKIGVTNRFKKQTDSIEYYCNLAWIDSETFSDETKNKYGVVPEIPTAVASATTFGEWLYIKFFDEALEIAGHKSDDEVSLRRLLGPSNAGGFDIKFSFYSYEPKIFYTQMFQNEAYINPDKYDSNTGWDDGFVLKRIVGDNNICKRFTKAGFEEAIKKYSETADYKIAYTLDEFGGLYLFCPKESNGGSYKWITNQNENGDVYDSIDKFTRILAGNNITVEYKNITLKDEWGGLGLGVLSEISSPMVKRELNGEYEFSFTYPVTGRHFNELKPRAIVVTKPSANENPQGFRIYKTTKPINGQITVNCQHISYDQSGIFAIPFATPVSESGSSLYSSDDMISSLIGAASKISPDSEFAKTGRITVEGGKVLVNQQFYSDDPKSLRSLIGADDGSILSILGGDVVFDNFKTTFYPKGYCNKTGFSIRYGKNMTEYSEEEDESGAYSRVYPFWKPKNSTSTSSSNLDNYKINPAYAAGSNISGSSNTDSVLSGINGTYIPTAYNPSDFLGELPFKQFLEKELASGRSIDTGKILQSPDGTERYVYDSKNKTIIDANKSTQETAETTSETNYLDLDGYSHSAGTKTTIEGEEYVSLFADGRIVVADQENIDNPYFKTMTLDLSDAFENKGLLTYDSIDNFPKPSEITKTQAKCIFTDSSKSRKYLYDPFKDSGTKDKDGNIIYGAYIDYSGIPDKNALYLEAYWYIVENDIAKPKVTFTLSYVELYRNKDASALSVLEQVNLGDTIKIKMNLYNTDVDVKCTGMSYNPISKRVESITVGTPKKDLASTISEQAEKISKTPDKKTVSTLVDSTIAPALQVTTSLITGNTGGFAMLYNSRTGKTSTTPKATTAWATMNEDGKNGIPFRKYDEMYDFITNLEGGISDDILFKYAPGVKKEDGTYDYKDAPVYDFTWSSRLLRARIFDISIDNSEASDISAKLTFKSILFNIPLWYNKSEYEASEENTEAKWFMFSAPILVMCGTTISSLVQTRIALGLEAVFNDSKFSGYHFIAKFTINNTEYSGTSATLTSEDISGSRQIDIWLDAQGYYFAKVNDKVGTFPEIVSLNDIGVVWASGFEKYNQDVSAPDEFLIMNTNDINTATQVWRWNKSGLMFSKSEKPGDAYFGFNSKTPLAMDMTGKIIANEIYAEKLQINDVTVDNGLYLRGKYAEKVFSSKNGFTVINPNSSSAYIKYTFQDGEIKPLPTETNNVLYYTEDFHNTDETSNEQLSGSINIKKSDKILVKNLVPITYNTLLREDTIADETKSYIAVSKNGEMVFKLFGISNLDKLSGFFTSENTISVKYPIENRTSFYTDAGIDSVFSGKTYVTLLSGAHRETDISVGCQIFGADKDQYNLLKASEYPSFTNSNEYVLNGITFIKKEDGSILVRGTATADTECRLSAYTAMPGGFKFFLTGCPVGGSTNTYYLYDGNSGASDIGNGVFVTSWSPEAYSVTIQIKAGTTMDNKEFVPRLYNLTEMFGSGLEPTNLEEFNEMFDGSLGVCIDDVIVSADVTHTKLSLWYRAVPGTTNIPKNGTIGDYYSWRDSFGSNISITYYLHGDKNAHFAYIPVSAMVSGEIYTKDNKQVLSGDNYIGSVIIPYNKSQLQTGSSAPHVTNGREFDYTIMETRLNPGLTSKIEVYDSDKSVARPVIYVDGTVIPYTEKTSLGSVEINGTGIWSEQRFGNGCFKIVDTKELRVHHDIESHGSINFSRYSGEEDDIRGIYGIDTISFHGKQGTINPATKINTYDINTQTGTFTKIDLFRGINGANPAFPIDPSEAGMIRFPLMAGGNHAPTGGAFYLGLSEFKGVPAITIWRYSEANQKWEAFLRCYPTAMSGNGTAWTKLTDPAPQPPQN